MAARRKPGKGQASPAPSSFLGALRSELDDDSGLHEWFVALEAAASAVRAAYLSFRVSPESAAQVMERLRLRSQGQDEWTIGASSGGWYSRPVGGRAWQLCEPPIGVAPDSREEPDWLRNGIGLELADPAVQHEGSAVITPRPLQQAQQAALAQPVEVIVERPTILPTVRAADPSGDMSWLLEEWDQAPQIVPVRGNGSVVAGSTVGLPEDLPGKWDDDRAMQRELDNAAATPIRDRDDEFTAPEDFFLRPDS